jgi:hypothetical protein
MMITMMIMMVVQVMKMYEKTVLWRTFGLKTKQLTQEAT